jgi:hypothetical protein
MTSARAVANAARARIDISVVLLSVKDCDVHVRAITGRSVVMHDAKQAKQRLSTFKIHYMVDYLLFISALSVLTVM